MGRDLLILTIYLPPGDAYSQTRNDTLQGVAMAIKHTRGLWMIVGD